MPDFNDLLTSGRGHAAPPPPPPATPPPAGDGAFSFSAPPAPSARTGAKLQCQPTLRANADNLWSRTEQAVETMHRAMLDACRSLGIEAYVGRSNTFEFPASVRFECWVPPVPGDTHLTERAWAQIVVEPKPNHRFELEYSVEVENRGRKRFLGKFGAMPERDVQQLVNHLVRRAARPRFGPRLALPKQGFFASLGAVYNKPTDSRPDRLRAAGAAALVLGLIVLFIAFASQEAGVFVFGLLLTALGAAIALYIAGRPLAVRSTGRPPQQPRRLRIYDSWQTVVFGAAQGGDTFRQRFLALFPQAPVPGLKAEVERIGYRVLDEALTREQIVLTAQRTVIYCQVYHFGEDLYLGWQSFINQGRWSEKVDGHGIDRATGRRVQMRSVLPSAEGLCEYDLFDANCLTEWTHAQVVILTKQMMKELQIDQEIDFKIVRGDRSGIGREGDGGEKKDKPAEPETPVSRLFRRKS